MIFSNACCFKLYECLFTVSVVDRHFLSLILKIVVTTLFSVVT